MNKSMKMQHDAIKMITRDPTCMIFIANERSDWILNWDKYGAKKWINFNSVNTDSLKCQIECFADDCQKKKYILKNFNRRDDRAGLTKYDDHERKRKQASYCVFESVFKKSF